MNHDPQHVIAESVTADSTENRPFVSVIVPTYNRVECLLTACRSLLQQDYPNYELIVVDQSESIADEMQDFFCENNHIVYHRLDRPNRCRSKNFGIHKARGEIVLICDDDIIAPGDLISMHVRHYADRKVGAGSCRIVEDGQPETRTRNVLKLTFYGKMINNAHSLTSMGRVKSVNGGNMSFRRKLLLKSGMLDESFIGTGIMEEQDVSIRIRKLGYRIFFDADTTVKHCPQRGGNLAAIDSDRAEWFHCYFHNLAWCWRKNRRYFFLITSFPFVTLLSLKHVLTSRLPFSALVHMVSGFFKGIIHRPQQQL